MLKFQPISEKSAKTLQATFSTQSVYGYNDADLYITSFSRCRCLGVRQNTVWLKSLQGQVKFKRVGSRVFDSCKRRVMGELNTADSQVMTSEHCRPVTMVLHFLLFTGKIQKVKEVVFVKEDVT